MFDYIAKLIVVWHGSCITQMYSFLKLGLFFMTTNVYGHIYKFLNKTIATHVRRYNLMHDHSVNFFQK